MLFAVDIRYIYNGDLSQGLHKSVQSLWQTSKSRFLKMMSHSGPWNASFCFTRFGQAKYRFDVCHVMMFWQVLPEVIYFDKLGQAWSHRVGWWCECETECVWLVIVDKLCSWSLQKRNLLYIVILFRKPVSSSQCAKSSIRSSMRLRSALSHIPIEFFRALQI